MAAKLNLTALAQPFSIMSGGFSNLFGNTDYSSLIKLMGLQMEALQIMDNKLDIIYSQINQVYQVLDDIKDELKGLPGKTATKIFADQLTGTLSNFQSELKAYKKQSTDNPASEEYYLSSFEKCFEYILDRKASLMVSGNYYNLPLIGACILFETLSGVLIGRPKESIDESLKNYKEWVTYRLAELDESIKGERQGWNNAVQTIQIENLYSGCFHKIDQQFYWKNGESFMVDPFHIEYYFGKYSLYQIQTPITEIEVSIHELLKEQYISELEVPSRLECRLIGSPRLNVVAFSSWHDDDPHEVVNIKFEDGSQVQLNKGSLKSLPSCIADPIGKGKLQQDPKILELSDNLSRQSHNILAFASLQRIAKKSLHFIATILSEDEISSVELEQASFIMQVQQQKALQWVAFLEANKDFVKEETKKEKLQELQQKMSILQSQSKANFEAYAKVEQEILSNLPKDLIAIFLESLASAGKEIEKAVQNISHEAEKLGQNLAKNIEKAVIDIESNSEKAVADVGELFVALEHYVENQVNSYLETLEETEKRVREGKIVDAIWHVCIDPYKKNDENLAKMVQESTLANSIVSSIVTVYVPIYGAALYSAWYTYRLTGSLEMALKTGTITFLTSQGLSATSKIPNLTQRVLASSMVGAAAIAASGGSEKDILDGFIKGASMNIANEIYHETTKLDIEGKAPTKMEPYKKEELLKNTSMTFLNKDGKPVLDITKLSRDVTHVGIDKVSAGIVSEHSWLMQGFANIPYINDMAYFHDQWCAINAIENGLITKLTIIPATILTVAGSNGPVLEEIIEVMKKGK